MMIRKLHFLEVTQNFEGKNFYSCEIHIAQIYTEFVSLFYFTEFSLRNHESCHKFHKMDYIRSHF